MKKITFWFCLLACVFVSLSSCTEVSPDAGQEAVLIDKPVMFGDGGIRKEAVPTGLQWTWLSTDVVYFDIRPHKHQVNILDLATNNNTLLDFHTAVITQIKKGKSPILCENYATDSTWFDTNLYNFYCKRVRYYVSQYSPFDLMSNKETLDMIDAKLLVEMREYVAELSKRAEFPIDILDVIIGRGMPNDEQLAEMNETARQVQAKQTEERRAEAERARGKAEEERAKADKAYQREMGLTTDQFIQLRAWDIIEKKQGANIDIMFNADRTNKMWHINKDK